MLKKYFIVNIKAAIKAAFFVPQARRKKAYFLYLDLWSPHVKILRERK